MREDMHEVVIERPRYGSRSKSKKWGRRVGEDFEGETFVSSARRRQYGWHAKELSDFLTPLRRYLHKQVGRPWDKVYAEIRKAVPEGLHGDHLWSHIRHEVRVHCYERDGRVFTVAPYWGEEEVSGLYVHPRTGLLSRKRRASKPPIKPRPVNEIALSDSEEFRKIDGVWYHRKFVLIDIDGRLHRQYTEKKQLSREELRELRKTHPGTLDTIRSKPIRI
jgi:hypothetical protein